MADLDFDIQIDDITQLRILTHLTSKGGNEFTSVPPGGTIDCVSDNPGSVNPLPEPGGVSFSSQSVAVGVSNITVTFGGNLSNIAARSGRVTVIESEPAGAHLEAITSPEEPPPPPPSTP